MRLLAIAVAVHGVVFAIAGVTLARVESPALEALAEVHYFVVIAPALILAMPFWPILWRLHLMENPGWFAWPKPAGFALVYIAWVVALLALSLLVRRFNRRRR